jgi:hypothetical protein
MLENGLYLLKKLKLVEVWNWIFVFQ